MKHRTWSDILESSQVLILLSVLGATYLVCMFVAPVIQGRGDWEYVQAVWDRWQSLNVGVLAFAASVTAFSIARGSERRQLQREFVSSRALLPHALSELARYCEDSAAYLIEVRDAFSGWVAYADLEVKGLSQPPEIPQDVFTIFTQCIRTGESQVAEYLAQMLSALQVHRSRMRDLSLMPTQPSRRVVNADELPLTYLVSLAKIRVDIDKIFSLARGEGDLDTTETDARAMHTAFSMMKIVPEEVEGLPERIRRAVKG